MKNKQFITWDEFIEECRVPEALKLKYLIYDILQGTFEYEHHRRKERR